MTRVREKRQEESSRTYPLERSTTFTRPFSLNLGKNPLWPTSESQTMQPVRSSTSRVCLFPDQHNLSAKADMQPSKMSNRCGPSGRRWIDGRIQKIDTRDKEIVAIYKLDPFHPAEYILISIQIPELVALRDSHPSGPPSKLPNEVVLGELSIPNLLLKNIFAIFHVSPESGSGELLLYSKSVVFMHFTKHVRSENLEWNGMEQGLRRETPRVSPEPALDLTRTATFQQSTQ